MSDGSKIEWTDATWQPITGCSVVSPGCTNCYAMRLAGGRLRNHPSRAGLTKDSKAGPVWTGEVRFNAQWLDQPLRWRKPRRVFVCAHGDLFHENVPDEWIAKIWRMMEEAKQHQFQILTKRPERMRAFLIRCANGDGLGWITHDGTAPKGYGGTGEIVGAANRWPLPNVWLGVSAEDQPRADERIPLLLDTPAAVRFVSAEPLLGAIDFTAIRGFYRAPAEHRVDRASCRERMDTLRGSDRREHLRTDGTWNHRRIDDPDGDPCFTGNCHPRLDWIIVGGESGPGARPMHPDWVRSIRDQCEAADVPFFFKQWGDWLPDRVLEHLGVRGCLMQPSGRRFTEADLAGMGEWPEASLDPSWQHFAALGKSRAGRDLDGRTWDGMPQ